MTAAVTAAAHGLTVVVVDEQAKAGGQIFRQPPSEFAANPVFPAGYAWGGQLIRASQDAGRITWRFGTTAFGVLHEEGSLQLAVHGADGPSIITADRLLIATGAYDMPVAFPGWTLPGVMTAGAVQTLLKSQRLLVASRLVLAGSHPLLIVVADQLRRAGAQIAEVAYARPVPGLRDALRCLPALPGHGKLLAGTARSLAGLVSSGTRISSRTIVARAHGHEAVTAVDLAPVDHAWQVTGPARTLSTEVLVLGYGFLPSTELARQAGCGMRYDAALGGWVVVHDAAMRTTMPALFVAGEPAGVAGAEQSRAQGQLAALAIADDLRPASRPSRRRQNRSARRQARTATRFSYTVQSLFQPRQDALTALATPDTIVCRCELVTRAAIDDTLAANPYISTASAAKLQCRAGMGSCQGRYCESTLSSIITTIRGCTPEQAGYFNAQLPVKPVPVSALAELDTD
jgi:D-hydroxyproline dehydrogenase subunit alpha